MIQGTNAGAPAGATARILQCTVAFPTDTDLSPERTMTRITRRLLGLAAVAAAFSAAPAAGAQAAPQDQPQPRAERATTKDGSASKAKRARAPRRYRNVSAGEVERVGEPRAHPRDFYGADDPRCDDLCQRERMMDEKYGKDRERLPGARRGS